MNELHLFAGNGAGILGGMLLGHTPVCAVEIEPFKRKTIFQRQRDGILPKFPVWDDIRTFDGRPWRGRVDIVAGGFPCQDISVIGSGDGLDGERSGLWSEFRRVVGEVRPAYIELENSPALVVRGLMRILGEIAELGYDARWGVLGSYHAGGPCKRERLWLLADSTQRRLQRRDKFESQRRKIAQLGIEAFVKGCAWPDVSNPRTFGSVDGSADRVERTKAIGDGQIPAVAWLAWKALT